MNHNKYELEQKEEVKRYITDRNILNSNTITVEEIGNGNMNYVYRMTEDNTGKTLILKFSANHTRISKDIHVSTERNRVEARALAYFSKYVPFYVPKLILFDEENHCIIMQDYNNFVTLRDLLLKQKQIPQFAEQITDYFVQSILPTSELVLDKLSKIKLNVEFINPLCEITKSFVFTEPFDPHGSTNAILEGNRSYIEQAVFLNQQLKTEIDNLKNTFSNKKQALLHGDLHTGSILTDEKSIIVFDFEFAFIGPIGFDLGNLIANFIFAWLNSKASNPIEDYLKWIEDIIEKTVNLFMKKFSDQWSSLFIESKADRSININEYIDEIIQDTAAYTGVELLRRIIGIAHVADITSINSEEERLKAERIAIEAAIYFILNKCNFHNGTDFIKVLLDTSKGFNPK